MLLTFSFPLTSSWAAQTTLHTHADQHECGCQRFPVPVSIMTRCRSCLYWRRLVLGVANGKIRDSPRRRDPCLKIWDRDLKAWTKSEPESLCQENRARDFILRKSEPVSKTVGSETWQWATRYSINIRSISQEFQNVSPWRLIFDLKTRLVAPIYSKDCYRMFLIK